MIKNKLLNYLLLLIFTFICIAIGNEYPSIIEVPKKSIKFLLKKVGITDTFVVQRKDLENINKEKKAGLSDQKITIEGNSFNLVYSKVLNFNGRTAGLFVDNSSNKKLEFDVYLQDGINIKKNFTKELNLPIDIFLEKNGGVKSIIKINSNNYALISNKNNLNCYFSSVVNLNNAKKIFSTKCLPDIERIDFNGIGGAYIEKDNSIFLSIGAPEWDSEEIRMLAQNMSSKYGKIIKFDKKAFGNDQILKEDYKIFSRGHKNPQGLVLSENQIFSVEHGPQGGDEINLIEQDKNYGWPIVSYGTRYNDGKSYRKSFENMANPIFSFLPSIAPSTINNCPENLSEYYSNHSCLLVLSLRAMSIFVILVNKEKLNVISVEKFKLNQRLRHFALDKNNKMFQRDNSFFISADGFGILKIKFDNFR